MNWKLQHVQQHLLCVQGMEHAEIDQATLSAVRNRLTTLADDVEWTQKHVYDALRELRLQKLYNHARLVRRLLTGAHVEISAEQERKIIELFVQVELHWSDLYCNHGINYAFVLHNICNALGYLELAQNFAIPSQSKRRVNEERWQKCIKKHQLLMVLQSHCRRRKAIAAVDMLRAEPANLFDPVYGQRRQGILQKRDQCCWKCWKEGPLGYFK